MSVIEKAPLLDRFAGIVAEVTGVRRECVLMGTTLAALGADCLEILDVMLRAEQAFGVDLTDDEIELAPTIGDIIATFERKGAA